MVQARKPAGSPNSTGGQYDRSPVSMAGMPPALGDGQNVIITRDQCYEEELRDGRYAHATLRGCDLRYLDMVDVSLQDSVLDHCDLTGSHDWKQANMDGLKLAGDLTGVDFRRARMQTCKVTTSQWQEVYCTEANLSGLRFDSPDGEGVTFQDCEFGGARLHDAGFNEQDTAPLFNTCGFIQADLSDMRMPGACVEQSDFTDAKLAGMDMSDATFSTCVFINVTGFDTATMSGASFDHCIFDNLGYAQEHSLFTQPNVSFDECRLYAGESDWCMRYSRQNGRAVAVCQNEYDRDLFRVHTPHEPNPARWMDEGQMQADIRMFDADRQADLLSMADWEHGVWSHTDIPLCAASLG